MSNNNGTPPRRDTQETLIGSPVASAEKKQWPKSGSPTTQRKKSCQTLADSGIKWENPRRGSTGNTLIEVPEGKPLLDKLGSPSLSEVDDVLVTSPTSTLGRSAFFSPLTPGSTVPPLTPADSIPPSPGISKWKKGIRTVFKRPANIDGETIESIRATASFAARATLSLAEASDLPYLKGVAGIVLLILDYAEGVTANKEECLRIIKSVARLLKTLELRIDESDDRNSEALYEQARELKSTLELVLQDVKQLSDRKRCYFEKFMKKDTDKEIIKRCNAELEHAFKIFHLQSTVEIQKGIVGLQHETRELKIQLDMKRSPLSTRFGNPESAQWCTSDISLNCGLKQEAQRPYDPTAIQRAAEQRLKEKAALRLAALPPLPAFFFGRSEVLQQLVQRVVQPTAEHIAILGPGGVGKSSLTLSLLHHKDVAAHYQDNRFFVPCDSATSLEGLISVIASHIGLSEEHGKKNNRPGQREADIIAYLTGAQDTSDCAVTSRPIILVLDNFETPWEPNRGDVETFLGRLAAADNVTLIITLRGTERPRGVKWNRPFLPPLQTLDPLSARKMFLEISDVKYEPSCNTACPDELDELLCLCSRLPLAIRLMAEMPDLAETDDCTIPDLVKMWKESSISVLSTADDPNHSLQVSIELSLNSPRMKRVPDAATLLALLAMLPDGIREVDLETAVPLLHNLDKCRVTLIRTSLAYSDKASGRMKVLAPIRAYIASSSQYKAPFNWVKPLENYFWRFIDCAGQGQRDEGIIKRALPELGNIENLIDRAFREDFEPSSSVAAAVNLANFFLQASLGEPRMVQLQKALVLSEQMENEKLEADCIYTMALTKHRFFVVREDTASCGDEFLKALALYERVNDKAGQGDCLHQLGAFYHTDRRFEEAKDYTEKALHAHVEAGCLRGQVSALSNLARLLEMMNEIQPAIKRGHEALDLLRTNYTDPLLEAQCLEFLGTLHCGTLCNYEVARELLEESFRIFKALGLEESANCMDTIVSMGDVAFVCSRFDEAKDAFQKAAMIYRKMKRRDREANALVCLGLACLGLELPDEASAYIHKGLVIWEEIRNTWGIGITHLALGDVAMHEGAFSQADDNYTKALRCFRDDSSHWKTFEAESLLKIGILRSRTEHDIAARESLQEALRLYDKTACRRGRANCLRELAKLDLKAGDSDSEAERASLAQLEIVEREYSEMGLLVEGQQCALLIAGTYKSLGEKPPKSHQLHIKT